MKLVKKDLEWAMKYALIEMVLDSKKFKSQKTKDFAIKYINEKFNHNKIKKVLSESIKVFKEDYTTDPAYQQNLKDFNYKSQNIKTGNNFIGQVRDKVGQYGKDFIQGTKQGIDINNPVTSGALTISGITALIAGAIYIYKRFLSAAARACSVKSGSEKDLCMKKFNTR
jgi:hypothetical protein